MPQEFPFTKSMRPNDFIQWINATEFFQTPKTSSDANYAENDLEKEFKRSRKLSQNNSWKMSLKDEFRFLDL